jgi:cardiolipin synthase
MKLIVQPDEGVAPIVTAIKQANKTIDILIFRLDRWEVARALAAAVARGVHVRALTAHQNRGGTKSLRKLEMSLLEAGVTVSRTADDLVRYHGKLMIIDGRILHVYGFNFTALDIQKSRSFGVVTKNPKLVSEASKLFEADFERQPYKPGNDRLVVSPENSRERLSAFIKATRKQLLIYDPQVTDDAMLRLVTELIKKKIEVRIIGKVEAKWNLKFERFPGRRLHVRAMVRDGRRAFIGSQSLRRLELVVRQLQAVFQADWALTPVGKKQAKKAAKKEDKLAAAS